MSQLETADEVLNQEIYGAIGQVWDSYYPIGEQQDLAFCLGLLLGQMQYYAPALQYFQQSMKLYGPDFQVTQSANGAECHATGG
ncbi:MAG: hypothetical protein EBE86_028985 [Hormoscilla sp. GUM202]|nr:hypothetical protein [Hormoscilla sp. GUM202]